MSALKYLVCDVCKEALNIGQFDGINGEYIYNEPKDILRLEDFLKKHKGHSLCYIDEGASVAPDLEMFLTDKFEYLSI